jgi:hypothetical protein
MSAQNDKITIQLSNDDVKHLREKLINRKKKLRTKKDTKKNTKKDNDTKDNDTKDNDSKDNDSKDNDEPPYGNLKNGIKPTYSEWKKSTIKTKSIVGKMNNNIYVFIANENTRKRYGKKSKAKTIREMKKLLIKNNVLRSKSNAPDDIVKCMYDNTLAVGNTENTNENVLLFNYLNSNSCL